MPTDSKDKRGKNKMGEYFPVYSISSIKTGISSSKTDIVFTKIMEIGKASTTTGKKSTQTGTASTGSLKGNCRCHWIFWNQQMIFFPESGWGIQFWTLRLPLFMNYVLVIIDIQMYYCLYSKWFVSKIIYPWIIYD